MNNKIKSTESISPSFFEKKKGGGGGMKYLAAGEINLVQRGSRVLVRYMANV